MTYVYYNPLADNGRGRVNALRLKDILHDDALDFQDITKVENIPAIFHGLEDDDRIIIAGGDGTLNRFVNAVGECETKGKVYYFPTGSGNDFKRDVENGNEKAGIIPLREYLNKLPVVSVGDKTVHFINGVGYGIDGYCCEAGDEQKEKSDKPVNYTAIAVKGLLFHYKPTGATVTVDGVKHHYKRVWLAPTMNGRYYGGGMNVAPEQNRLADDKTVTTVVLHGGGKLKTLAVFPSIFKGEHVAHKKMVDVLTGKEVTVAFDRPTPMQIDGETVKNVTEYSVRTADVLEKRREAVSA